MCRQPLLQNVSRGLHAEEYAIAEMVVVREKFAGRQIHTVVIKRLHPFSQVATVIHSSTTLVLICATSYSGYVNNFKPFEYFF